jgi:hypothetical protein
MSHNVIGSCSLLRKLVRPEWQVAMPVGDTFGHWPHIESYTSFIEPGIQDPHGV